MVDYQQSVPDDERDAQWRHAALEQAAHDFKGNAPASAVVERAMVYYEFLIGQRPGASD